MNESILCDIGQISLLDGRQFRHANPGGWCMKEAINFYGKHFDEYCDGKAVHRIIGFARCSAHSNSELLGWNITREQYVVIQVMGL